MSTGHRRVTASRLPSARGCLFSAGTACWFHGPVWARLRSPARRAGGTDTGQPGAAAPGQPGEIPLLPFVPAAAVLRIEPCVSLGEAGAAVGAPRARSLWFKLPWRWRCGRQWQICPVLSLVEAVYDPAAPAAHFAPQAVLNRISSACAGKVCARARLKTGYRHTHGGVSAPDCICWGYSSQSGTGHLPQALDVVGGCPVSSPML